MAEWYCKIWSSDRSTIERDGDELVNRTRCRSILWKEKRTERSFGDRNARWRIAEEHQQWLRGCSSPSSSIRDSCHLWKSRVKKLFNIWARIHDGFTLVSDWDATNRGESPRRLGWLSNGGVILGCARIPIRLCKCIYIFIHLNPMFFFHPHHWEYICNFSVCRASFPTDMDVDRSQVIH